MAAVVCLAFVVMPEDVVALQLDERCARLDRLIERCRRPTGSGFDGGCDDVELATLPS
jgi:hypothetical protein